MQFPTQMVIAQARENNLFTICGASLWQFHWISFIRAEKQCCISDMKLKWTKKNNQSKSFLLLLSINLASYKILEITPWVSPEKLRSKVYGINRIRWTAWESSTLYIFLFWRYTWYTICIFPGRQCLWIKFVFQLTMTSLGTRVQIQYKFWQPSA